MADQFFSAVDGRLTLKVSSVFLFYPGRLYLHKVRGVKPAKK
ncbi:MAG: hypothetical protein JWR54_401 [Mucilaginibacter sp.]|nr:hypothetical protein [Mucilaginibacter sp.]